MKFNKHQIEKLMTWARNSAAREECRCNRMICFASPEHPHWREEDKDLYAGYYGSMDGYVSWNHKCPVHGLPYSGSHPDGPEASVWYEAWWKKMQAEKTEEAA